MNNNIQNTDQWLKDRLGKWNASTIGDLMGKGKKKDEMFGQTALSYIYGIAAERDMISAYIEDDSLWEIYQHQVYTNNKHTDWGHENEPIAAEVFEAITGLKTKVVGRYDSPDIPNLSASPDRLADDNGKESLVEIKCPLPKTFMRYKAEIKDNESLLKVNADYYYQIQAQMLTTGISNAYFVCFCPFLKHAIHIVPIKKDEVVQEDMRLRINEAEKIINNILK